MPSTQDENRSSPRYIITDHWRKTAVLRASGEEKKTGHVSMAARRPQSNASEIPNENDIQMHAVNYR